MQAQEDVLVEENQKEQLDQTREDLKPGNGEEGSFEYVIKEMKDIV